MSAAAGRGEADTQTQKTTVPVFVLEILRLKAQPESQHCNDPGDLCTTKGFCFHSTILSHRIKN